MPGPTRARPVVSEALVAGLLAGYGVAVPVGAIAALIVSLTARTSFRVGAAAALGVATADGVYALAAVLGGAALARLIEPVGHAPAVGGGGGAGGLAARTAITAVRHHRDPGRGPVRPGLATPGRAYLGLLGLTLLNPATIVYFGALVLGRQAGDGLTAAGEVVFVGGGVRRVRELATRSWPAAEVWSAGCSPARAGGWPRRSCPAGSSSCSRPDCCCTPDDNRPPGAEPTRRRDPASLAESRPPLRNRRPGGA